MTAPIMSGYSVAPHVYHCATAGQVVLLDLKNDRYVGLGNAQARALVGVVEDWPPSLDQIAGDPNEPPVDTAALIDGMLQKGLITKKADARTRTMRSSVPPARRAIPPFPRVQLTAGRIANFAAAATIAGIALRFRRLDNVVANVARRANASSREQPAFEEVTDLVAAFSALRPLLFTAKEACLFDSLALLEFLSRYRIFPTWVIGVLAAPFAAHSWLQLDDVVLNDYPEHVLHYVPILTV